jgi:hypothetical protein
MEKNNIIKTTMMAGLSLFATNSTSALPRYIVQNKAIQHISVPVQEPSSTRFNNSERYSLEKLKLNKQKLYSFNSLKFNWNGYEGEVINDEVIKIVEKLITKLEIQPQIFPTGRGSIQIEYYKNEENLIEIEISEFYA